MDTQEVRVFVVVLIIAVTLAVIIASFLVSVFRHQRRLRQLQQALALAELNAMEAERARIAADLHDGIAPQLSVVKFQIDSVTVTEEEDRIQLQRACETIDELLTHLRELSATLMPASLVSKGLVTALTEYIRKINETGSLEIELDVHPDFLLPVAFHTNVFRMLQEIIYNVCRHAKATKLLVRMQPSGGFAEILVRDNGIGFNIDRTLAKTKGIGLRNIKNRAAALNGTLQLESIEGRGTAFKIIVPVNIS